MKHNQHNLTNNSFGTSISLFRHHGVCHGVSVPIGSQFCFFYQNQATATNWRTYKGAKIYM